MARRRYRRNQRKQAERSWNLLEIIASVLWAIGSASLAIGTVFPLLELSGLHVGIALGISLGATALLCFVAKKLTDRVLGKILQRVDANRRKEVCRQFAFDIFEGSAPGTVLFLTALLGVTFKFDLSVELRISVVAGAALLGTIFAVVYGFFRISSAVSEGRYRCVEPPSAADGPSMGPRYDWLPKPVAPPPFVPPSPAAASAPAEVYADRRGKGPRSVRFHHTVVGGEEESRQPAHNPSWEGAAPARRHSV